MKTQETFYAIELVGKALGTRQLAIGATPGGPLLYYWRFWATKAKNDFRRNGFKTARVVKVVATFEWKA